MRAAVGLALLLAACGGHPVVADGGSGCAVATDCPEIGCQCSGGQVPSACLCLGGRAASGACGPGGVCATANDCVQACAQTFGMGGGTSGGSNGGGGGIPCASSAECQPMTCSCPDAGSTQVQTVCLQGQCTPAATCPSC